MKNIMLISFIILFLTGCGHKEQKESVKDLIRQNWIEEKLKENNMSLYYELESGIKIYSSLKQIKYTDDYGLEKELKTQLKSKKITMEEFVKKMDVYTSSNDGGSVYFEAPETLTSTKFYLAWCNSMLANGGIKDIFILEDKEEILKFCVIEDEEYYN